MKLKHFIVGIIIIIIDQVSKALMINKSFSLIPNFLEFNYTENTGGAFGVGKGDIILVVSVLIIAVLVALVMIDAANKSKGKRQLITNYMPCALILAGSISNLLDRIFRGFVVDFIDVNVFNFPNFNIADIAIVVGILILIVILIKEILKKDKSESEDHESESEDGESESK